MRSSNLKILAILFAALFFVNESSAQDDARAAKTWQVLKYDLTATLPATDAVRDLNVKAILSLKNTSGSPASSLTLRLNQNAAISDLKLNGSTADFSKREEKLTAANSLQRIVVRMPSLPANEIISVEVNYKLLIKENSGVATLSSVSTNFLPLSFWYPTPNSWFFPRGADYAPFTLTAVSPAEWNLDFVSSGESSQTAGNNLKSSRFSQTFFGQPFFVGGNWDLTQVNDVSVYLPKGADSAKKRRGEELAELTSEAKLFVEGLLGKFPETYLRLVSVSRGAGFSGGGTILIDQSAFEREKIDSQTAMNIVEGIAKIPLGNIALVDGDGYGVIREGLARFIATEFIEKKFGKETADVERLRQRTAYSAVARRDSPLRIASPLDDYYYASVANKGAMIWRLVAVNVGKPEFFAIVRDKLQDKYIDLQELRSAFPSQKALLDYQLDEVLDTNLLVGLPQVKGDETKSAVRNTGSFDVTVNIVATTATGERINVETSVPAKGFGEVAFRTKSPIVRTEIDPDKIYPQTEYTDDVVPREDEDADAIVGIKRAFDKQEFTAAEKGARALLTRFPKFDDARILLGRSLLAQKKMSGAESEFRAVLEQNLPTARNIAWAKVGLGEIALAAGDKTRAVDLFSQAILADGEYGASLNARLGRRKAISQGAVDESIKKFFGAFDQAAVSGRKADLDRLFVPGEVTRFAAGVAGAQQWQTNVLFVEMIDANNAFVESSLNIRLLNREPESGTAVFQITRNGNSWKIVNVVMFEVR
ncbi:MAG: hypothetical protein KIS76_12540 [Pyrinomonadaceae bacterium]|nr:hypothetical protein [Pyrinomonadaceae bacterium]